VYQDKKLPIKANILNDADIQTKHNTR